MARRAVMKIDRNNPWDASLYPRIRALRNQKGRGAEGRGRTGVKRYRKRTKNSLYLKRDRKNKFS